MPVQKTLDFGVGRFCRPGTGLGWPRLRPGGSGGLRHPPMSKPWLDGSYDQHERDLLRKLKPEIEAWAKKGKPDIPWASKPSDLPQAAIPAFPGAEGGGMYSFGGRGGKVYVVNTLDDSGPGSLREACESAGPRIVVFNVAGIIQPEDANLYRNRALHHHRRPDGGGDGVYIADQGLVDNAHDVVIRYLRLRRGATDIFYRHGVHSGDPVGNIILDHMSASWGNDQNLDTYLRHMYQPPEGGRRTRCPVSMSPSNGASPAKGSTPGTMPLAATGADATPGSITIFLRATPAAIPASPWGTTLILLITSCSTGATAPSTAAMKRRW